MVSYEIPKPPLGFFQRARESVRLATAFFKGDKTTIADITSETVFSPLQPPQPYQPNIVGRAFDYQPGYNIQFKPDGYGRVPFAQLRAIARQCEILRLGLRTVKDQICAFEWQIVPKEDSPVEPDDPRIKELTDFFKRPDKINTFDEWLRLLLDDYLILDRVAIYRPKDRVGRPYAFELFDSATFKVLIDANGRLPQPPDPAYQQCYSDDTEVLTRNGWRLFSEIDPDCDEIATRNPHTKAFEWQKSDGVVANDYSGPMYNFTSKFLDIMVSPDHRMLVSRMPRGVGKRPPERGERIITAAQLAEHGNKTTSIPMTSVWMGTAIVDRLFPEDDPLAIRLELDAEIRELRNTGLSYERVAGEFDTSPMTAYRACNTYAERDRKPRPSDTFQIKMSGDDFAAFMGAYLSEGSCNLSSGKVVCISQKRHSKGFAPFERLLERIAPGRVRYVGDSFQIYSKPLVDYLRQFGHALEKWIPSEIMNATALQLEIFWDYFRLGDGAADRERMYTSSERMADQLQEIAQKIGCAASVLRREGSTTGIWENGAFRKITRGPSYTVGLRQWPTASIGGVTVSSYTGKIWCVSVPNTIIYVRRNGKPAWCGNCIKGSPRADYDTTELLLAQRSKTTDYPVRGVSILEDILITAQTSIERAKGQLMFFTEGTLPDSYGEMPEGMSPDSIRAFEDRFNDLLRGNTAMRRGTPFLPSGAKIVPLKQADLKNDADEWFTRIICFSLGIPPTAFIRQMNRSSAQSDKDRAQEEGQVPKMQFVKLIIDQLIADFGDNYAQNFEFTWRDTQNLDPKEQADVITEYVKAGVKTINEGRADLGMDPITGADAPMAFTPTGYVPLDSFEQNQEMQQQNMQAQAEARAAAQVSGAQPANDGKNGKAPNTEGAAATGAKKPKPKKPAKKLLGKAVRHKPIPFRRPIVEHAEAELRIKIHHILQKTAVSVAQQLSKKHFKLRKDDDDDDLEWAAAAAATVDSLDLSSLEALVDATPAYLSRIASDGGKQTLATLGVFDDGDLVNQVNADSLAFARARGAEMVGKKWVDGELVDNPNADWVISDATRDELRGIIGQVYAGDLDPSDLTSAIKNAGAFSDDRAALITRTELQNANAQGTLDGMRTAQKAGVKVLKSWQADDNACEDCLENQDDGDIPIDDEFSSGDDAPPAHPNAVLSGSMFMPYGALKRMISAEYDGVAISLRAGAYRTTIGPNHPMLTDTGLCQAKFLKKGDKLVCDSRTVEVAWACKSDFEKMELVENSFRALKTAFGYTRVAAARHDFHGDVEFCADEVDVVLPKRTLLNELDSLGIERMREEGLDGPDVQLLTIPSPGPGEQDIRVVFLTSAGGVRCGDVGHYTLIEIEEIEKVDFKGFAYDCTTETGLYCSDGFIVGNCECVIVPVTEDDADADEE